MRTIGGFFGCLLAGSLLALLPAASYAQSSRAGDRVGDLHGESIDRLIREVPSDDWAVWTGSERGWQQSDPDYRAQRGLPPQPTADGFRLDSSYKDAAMVADLLAGYARRYPELTHLERIGNSLEGRPLLALKISDNAARSEPEPAILLDGAHHGRELMATDMVLDAIQTLLSGYARDPRIKRYVDNFEIWCVPLVNPDGNHAYLNLSTAAGRKNKRDTDGDGLIDASEGVDLNRNYPFEWGSLSQWGPPKGPRHRYYPGPSAASEPETRAMIGLARRERYVAAISYHTKGTVIMPPYAAAGIDSPLNDEAWPVAQAVADATPIQPNGKRYRLRSRLYPVDGVAKDWLRAEIGTVAMVVEGPFNNPRDRLRRMSAIQASRPLWKTLLDRFLAGPSVTGRITDEDGVPLTAEVRIMEIVPRAGERWTNRPRDGLYARYLPSTGTYTIRVEAPGYEPAQLRLRVDEDRVDVDFVLYPESPLLAANQ